MIVREYKTPSGVTIRFHDSAYAEKTEAEKEELRHQLNETINIILRRQLNRNEVLHEARRTGSTKNARTAGKETQQAACKQEDTAAGGNY